MKEQYLKKIYDTFQFNDGILFRDFKKVFTHISIYEAKNQQVLNVRIALQHHKINSDGIVLYNTKVFLTSG